jgi:hypothetical protein
VVSVVVVVAGWFLEQVKPVVNASAIKDASTIVFIITFLINVLFAGPKSD